MAWEVAQKWISDRNAELLGTTAVFIEGMTEAFKERYKKPGGGYLQERGVQSQPAAVKATGSWDVSYPLRDYSAQIAWDDVTIAYMSAIELSNHIETVMIQNINTVRHQILHRLFDNVQESFIDDINGTLTIDPLANGDGVTYPPVLGSDTEATDNHYLESNYPASSIDDTNNPLVTIRDELEEHFGANTGGDNIVVFINNAERAKIEALTDFTVIPDYNIRVGDNVDVPFNLPNVPGRILGRGHNCWVVEYRWIPANYMLGIHLEAPAPLKMRVDPADTGLGSGLSLVARDTEFPFEMSFWRNRFGIGCGNRLNGVAMELGTGGTYTVPTAYD